MKILSFNRNMVSYTRVPDFSTLMGIVVALIFIFVAIQLGGNPGGFFDARSLLIVIGGTFFITLASFSLEEILKAHYVVWRTFFYRYQDLENVAQQVIRMASLARQKGYMFLEEDYSLKNNTFMRRGIEMLVDNVTEKDIIHTLEQDMNAKARRHERTIGILRKAADISPAMGLIGTLIGLVQMLGQLEDASTIGPSMAVALLTTLYGVILSYMFFSPLMTKLEGNAKNQMQSSVMYLEGIVSICRKENPRKLESTLNSLLPKSKHIQYVKEAKG